MILTILVGLIVIILSNSVTEYFGHSFLNPLAEIWLTILAIILILFV